MKANDLKETLAETTLTNTENGALGYSTTSSALVDFNFKLPSFRTADESIIKAEFTKVMMENKEWALKYLFFLRDVREGVGERRTFRVLCKYLATEFPDLLRDYIPMIPFYGRWDDVIELLDTPLQSEAMSFITATLKSDMIGAMAGTPISLCAKWLPSPNTSSKTTKAKAKKIIKLLGTSEQVYRKTLSKLREHIKVLERTISANEWDKVEYSTVPSIANIKYESAFMRHDEERRRTFLSDVKSGKTKINASVAFPYSIVKNYEGARQINDTFEEMWKALPDYGDLDGNSLVVSDGSYSMYCHIDKSETFAIHVAMSMAIYLSERIKGEFKDKFITFSENPKFVDLSQCANLHEKLVVMDQYHECANTDIAKVFKLVLDTALKNNYTQEDMPSNIITISDMEFDDGAEMDIPLFEEIKKQYAENGYKLPKLVFWNVNSRTNTIPVRQNEYGVALVSGFSPAIMKMVTSGNLDPLQIILEQILSERYADITVKEG